MLSHLDEVKTVTELPVDSLLPQEESLLGPDEEDAIPAAQPAPKRGQSRRRAKGRRPGSTATAGKNKGEQKQSGLSRKKSGLKHTKAVLCEILWTQSVGIFSATVQRS